MEHDAQLLMKANALPFLTHQKFKLCTLVFLDGQFSIWDGLQ